MKAQQKGAKNRMRHLTKTRYVDGIQCQKRLWLEMYEPEKGTPPDEARQRLFRQGHQVDQLARQHYPGGQEMPTDYRRIDEALQATRTAIESGEKRLYQAAFQHDGVTVVADILDEEEGGWHLIEVKMSTKVKPEHLDDVAVQKFVLESCGLRVSRTSVLVINNRCEYPNLDQLFLLEDVTERLGEAQEVSATLERFKAILKLDQEPEVRIGSHCTKPYECPFYQYCWQPHGERTIYHVQDMPWQSRNRLEDKGILYASDIPADFRLNDKARAGVERLLEQRVDVDQDGIEALLGRLQFPLTFFDFETDSGSIPRYPGTRPYQQVPFQFSLHIMDENGGLEHREYLHTQLSDPRPDLVRALLQSVPREGSIVVFNASFEKNVLLSLAEVFPQSSGELEGMAARLCDQLDIFRRHYRHYGFGPSNSLKSILPVLIPELSHEGLSVRDGVQAQVAWERILAREQGWEELAQELREYCRLDTLAMARLHEHISRVLV